MVISASQTILPEDLAKERIRAIIDADPGIKAEIDARINRISSTNTNALKKIDGWTHLTQQERDRLIEEKKRELAIFFVYTHNNVFGEAVDKALP